METSVRLYALGYDKVKTYLFAALFILGNLLLPQLCHLIPSGGLILLPIFFFTLIGAYKYGIYVGLLTAIFSPLCNYWLFGMPGEAMLPVILAKSVILAIAAAIVAKKTQKISLIALAVVVLAYQIPGVLIEWFSLHNLQPALSDFRIGFPGILTQVFGGYLVLKALSRV